MKIKKIKKIIIYALVAIIVSTSLILSYEEASEVKAAVVVDDAIIIATLLGAMGIVYIGSEWYGSNLAEDWYPDYGEELGEVEDNVIDLWNHEVWQMYDEGVITNPPDDFDPDNDDPEENPPTWEKLKQWMRAHPEVSLAIGTTTTLGTIFLSVANKLKSGIDNSEFVYPASIKLSDWTKGKMTEHYNNGRIYQIISGNGGTDGMNYDVYTMTTPPIRYFTNSNVSFNCQHIRYRDKWVVTSQTIAMLFGENVICNWTLFPSEEAYNEAVANGTDTINDGEWFMGDNKLSTLTNKTVRYNTDGSVADTGEIILPHEQISPVGQVDLAPLLQNLYDANQATEAEQAEQLQQEAVDVFIESLENPELNPEPNPNPNPDSGEDSGTTDPEINSSFLADLSHLFPFCIPFDLINCVKLLTAERETPCVEVPMHFKFVDVDYTWVIDLEDFNGVASVCRTMFLLLYIVGLVMVTRPLIRG